MATQAFLQLLTSVGDYIGSAIKTAGMVDSFDIYALQATSALWVRSP